MKTEKKVIGDNTVLTTYNIRMLYDDGTEYNILAFQSKSNKDVIYSLCCKPAGVEIDFCYMELIGLLRKDYKINSFPAYFEESDLSFCSFTLGNINYELWCHYANGVISLMTKDNTSENEVSDELAVYMVHHLLEAISNKKRGIIK